MEQFLEDYENWRQIEEAWPDFQLAVMRNDVRGEVLAIEKQPGNAPWDRGPGYQTIILPENYVENEGVEEYLTKNVEQDEAIEIAMLYIQEHP